MKKKLQYIWSFLIIMMTSLSYSVFQIAVPKKLVEERASLVLVMCDEKGEVSIGKYRLDPVIESNVIAQKDLEIITTDCVASINDMELLPTVNSTEEVIVYFELNAQFKVVKVMVLKECFLDPNPFDVVSFNLEDEIEFENLYSEMNDVNSDLDSLSALTDVVNNSDLSSLSANTTDHWFDQYLTYAKLFAIMQYNSLKKSLHKRVSWWS